MKKSQFRRLAYIIITYIIIITGPAAQHTFHLNKKIRRLATAQALTGSQRREGGAHSVTSCLFWHRRFWMHSDARGTEEETKALIRKWA